MSHAISSSGGTGFAAELAELIIQRETTQSESAHQEREAARASVRENAERQIDALHAAADATRTGAFLNAALTVGGSALTMQSAFSQYGADVASAQMKAGEATRDAKTVLDGGKQFASYSREATLLRTAGDAAVKLAAPLQALIGDSVAADHQADAKRSELLAEQARWQADDASSAIERSEKRSDKALDVLQSVYEENRSSARAIVGRI